MDLMYFLKNRLDFILQLYERATQPFEILKRKIDAGRAPYVDMRDPETVSEPAFLMEWKEADNSIMVIGHWCLCMVQATLRAYLAAYIGPYGPYGDFTPKLGSKPGNWFEKYQAVFKDELGIDLDGSPIHLSKLEQLNLTRDDLTHNVDILSMDIDRFEQHVERYPVGLFVDERWAELGMERIRVDEDKLQRAITLVREFCSWIDAQ